MTTIRPPSEPTEQGHPGDDPRAFRRSLGQFATGVTVMTTSHEGCLYGMAVNSFAALSLDPALVLWSIRKESTSLAAFKNAGHYAVNILAEDQVDLSNLFAKPGDDRFAKAPWSPGRFGAPLLEGVICTFECQLDQVIDGGDHYILVGRVEHYRCYRGKPLLFVQGRYGVTEELPPAPSAELPSPIPATDTAWLEDATMLRQLHLASHLMSSRFDRVRQQTGDSVAEFRIYGWLRSHSLQESMLRQWLYLGENEMQDALASLQSRGHLTREADGSLSLTASGQAHSVRNAECVQQFERHLFSDVSSDDLQAARRVLRAMVIRAQDDASA
jgi:flavin reductase (DIM6/NTAB) family NADH-FMN oxidoreductase RutF